MQEPFAPAIAANRFGLGARPGELDRPFVERLTRFWTNHFAVSIDRIAVLGLAGAFEREAIRPHVLGNFTELLFAAEQHPAMLLYLDNHLSVGPNSRAAKAAKRRQSERQIGINKNLAREILELHTLGVSGGYTQQDVTTFAEVLTGWSIGGEFSRARMEGRLKNVGGSNDGEPGKFAFRPLRPSSAWRRHSQKESWRPAHRIPRARRADRFVGAAAGEIQDTHRRVTSASLETEVFPDSSVARPLAGAAARLTRSSRLRRPQLPRWLILLFALGGVRLRLRGWLRRRFG